MRKIVLYIIALTGISVLMYGGCYSLKDHDIDAEPIAAVSAPSKDTITDSVLASIFQPDEVNIPMIFVKLPFNHNEYADAVRFKKYYYLLQDREKEYRKDTDYLNSLAESKDTLLFFKETERILNKWKKQDSPPLYLEQIFFSIFRAHQNQLISKLTKARKIHHYFKYFQNDFDSVDPESYKDVVVYGEYEIESLADIKGVEFEKERMQLLVKWLYLSAMYQAAIDPDFNFHQQMWINIDIPQGFVGSENYFAGIDPDGIKEPELRKAYKDSIMKNSWITRCYTQQIELRKGYNLLTRFLEGNIQILYALPPQNSNELDSLLNMYIIDEEFKK